MTVILDIVLWKQYIYFLSLSISSVPREKLQFGHVTPIRNHQKSQGTISLEIDGGWRAFNKSLDSSLTQSLVHRP